MLHRLLPILLILTFLTYIIFNFQTIRRDIVYKLGISGDPTTSCCSEEEVLNSNGDFIEDASTAIFNGQVINYPKTSLAVSYNYDSAVLGTASPSDEEKWIEVSLDEQRLRAWENNNLIMEFPISSG